MKKIRMLLFFLAAVCLLAVLPVRAESTETEIYEKSGAASLFDALPEEAGDILKNAGITASESRTGDAESFLYALSMGMREKLTAPVRALAVLLAAILLCRLITTLAPEALQALSGFCGAMTAAVVLFPPLSELTAKSATVIEAIGVFLAAAIPVYVGLLMTLGNVAAGTTYGALTLTAANGISALASGVTVPLLRVFLALSTVSAATSFSLKRLTDMLYKFLKWIMVLAVTLFTGILSLQTLISAQTDAVTGRTARMLASSAIPIVGGAFGDALAAISGSVSLIKSGVGAFGLLASFAVFLPICLEALAWIAVCILASLAAELFEETRLAAFFDGCVTALKLLLAAVFSVGAVAVICAGVVLCVRGAYA